MTSWTGQEFTGGRVVEHHGVFGREPPMRESDVRERQVAMERYRKGQTPAAICLSLGRARAWFYKWLKRSQEGEAQWFQDRSRRPKDSPRRTGASLEQQVVDVRVQLDAEGVFCGDQAILWRLEEMGFCPVPSLRTISRILARQGLVHRPKGRFEPKGKKYPRCQPRRPGTYIRSTSSVRAT